jgi:hypothetical protein
MTEHIHWEQKKADRIDSRLIKVEDTLEELERRIVSEPDAPSPTKRQTPKKRTS